MTIHTPRAGREYEIVKELRAELRRRKAAKAEAAKLVLIFTGTFTGTMVLLTGLLAAGIL